MWYKLIIETKDKIIKHKIKFAHIFTVNYDHKIKKHEFHCPIAAKLIFETDKSIFQYILFRVIIKSDKDGNIIIMSPYDSSYLLGEKLYFEKSYDKEMESLVKLYKQKTQLGLTIEEITEYNTAKGSYELRCLEKHNIPYDIGSGF
ncbi:hypothetical protein [Candidatus Mycoplasma mahonii]|uniref:hypothetical protein n=1 Tax=Candidatus Mycoplasma mahonii TaxID=3004105 RepID=UPI0026EA29BC|nr:hypothetical protein [Candidatus Mycoplasma mahonii]WKX02185.1 hypothetical protein O3I44_02160 [Candidatus Mycoplasma mahonii]